MRIKQVLINLLSNAIKFSDGSGVVHVGIESRADACQFFVKDGGIGIAPEHFERIFSSFEQVHKGNTRKYGGTGLGLSISRSLVRMHGGELWVESELGRGATFFFRIPKGLTGRPRAGAQRSPQRRHVVGRAGRNRARSWSREKSRISVFHHPCAPSVAPWSERACSTSRTTTRTGTSPSCASPRTSSWCAPPTRARPVSSSRRVQVELMAILMDIELRGSELNGIELTELFRGKRPAKSLPDYARGLPTFTNPIIFVTAHGARYSDVELMLFGADRVIAKPVNFQALTLALQSIQYSSSTRKR